MEPSVSRDAVFVRLMEAARTAEVEQLPDLVADAARELALGDAVIYVTDYAQRQLLPLPGRRVAARAPLDIEATLAGRSFQTLEMLETGAPHGSQWWLPIACGAERFGVLETAEHAAASDSARHARVLAEVTALLLIARRRSTDYLHRLRRREPMTLAAEVQWSLLPPLTFEAGPITISGMLEPSYEVAGDSFDYAVDDGMARVAILDAMGHGFEATRMAMLAVGAYRHARRSGCSLAEVCVAVDEVLGQRFDEGQFVTAQFVELDGRTGQLCWINAGHPAPLLIRRRDVIGTLTCVPTLPLGLGGDVVEIAEDRLEPGDRVLLFTDGVTEARSPSGDFFGDARLEDFVDRAESTDLPVPETVRRLAHALVDHQGGAPAQDDATMVMLEWRGPPDGTGTAGG